MLDMTEQKEHVKNVDKNSINNWYTIKKINVSVQLETQVL